MAIKGQNLRLFVNEKCFAASTNTTFDVSANVESITTKDDVDGWERNQCVGKSWSASVDGLVIADDVAIEYEAGFNTTGQTVTLNGQSKTAYKAKIDNFALNKDDIVTVFGSNTSHIGLGLINGNAVTIVAGPTDVIFFKATVLGNYNVFLLSAPTGIETARVDIVDAATAGVMTGEALSMLKNGTEVDAVWAVATDDRNRTMSSTIYCYGKMKVNKLTCTAQNRQNSTYSAQLIGIGELNFYTEDEN